MPYYMFECGDCGMPYTVRIEYHYFSKIKPQCIHCGSENVKRIYDEPTPFILKGDGWTTKKDDNNES